jgi:hypothetical protein
VSDSVMAMDTRIDNVLWDVKAAEHVYEGETLVLDCLFDQVRKILLLAAESARDEGRPRVKRQ